MDHFALPLSSEAVEQDLNKAAILRRQADALATAASATNDPAERVRLDQACQALHWEAHKYEKSRQRLT